ncbi:MAG: PIN domain-containing protein [Candidatus Electrothrix sp. GW3-4]|uniref:PIN domain-containing protein n=1 Tax=Candidatus Electrothrix sp. GW3-4 TaxID=3126740 RepID=UPI0030CDA2DF
MSVLVDSSVWIDYFRGSDHTNRLDYLIDEGLIVTNDLILAELIPPLNVRKQRRVISLLKALSRIPANIDWEDIIDMQTKCIRKGINKVGIPDLIIAQNAILNNLDLYTHDKHFKLMSQHISLSLY